ncbi:glutathione synthetase ATP-binding domain-like protein [Serendipita vermifera]|nr:glutathione synthetase ATP-binding domain-like protein [Serendipita vermifera]
MVSTRRPSPPFAIKLYNSLGVPWQGDETLLVTAVDESGQASIKLKATVSFGVLQFQESDDLVEYIDLQFEESQVIEMSGPPPAQGRYFVSLVLSNLDRVKVIDEFESIMEQDAHFLDMIGIVTNDQEAAQAGDIIRYLFVRPVSTELVLERSDFLRTSLRHAPGIIWVKDVPSTTDNIPPVIRKGSFLGCMLFRPSQSNSSLDTLLQRRCYALPLIGREHASKRTLVWLCPGESYDTRRAHLAAIAGLGLRVIVIDSPGAWLEKEAQFSANTTLSDAERPFSFIPLDVNDTQNLTLRIVEVLRAWSATNGIEIDGITTVQDRFLVIVCQVATILGLPTPGPPEAFQACVDKFQTRSLLPWKGIPTHIIQSREDITRAITAGVVFPAIIKPRSCSGSRGVFKVLSGDELYRLWDDGIFGDFGGQSIIEPFVKGPEVDVNIVLENGKILFWEISDNEPTSGDQSSADAADPKMRTFYERSQSIPSSLSSEIQQRLVTGAHQALQALGFSNGTGVFHTEARVDEVTGDPFIIEVNARTPGKNWAQLVQRVWGVDEIACHFLAALGRPLTQATRAYETPAMYGQCFAIPARQCGILLNDPLESVRGREDVFAMRTWPKGSEVTHPGERYGILTNIAYVHVVSGISAEDCQKRRDEIEQAVCPYFKDQNAPSPKLSFWTRVYRRWKAKFKI